MSRFPHEFASVRDVVLKEMAALHEEYGEIVRVAPGIVSFINPQAWTDIFAHKPGKLPFTKDPLRYTRDMWINGAPDLFTAEDTDHPRLRSVLKPAFSDKAIREQEPLIQANVDLLMKQLRKYPNSESSARIIDLNEWMNWTTFDLIGDLAFGEPFGCLQQGDYHPWVALIFNSIKAVSITGAIKQ